MSFPVEHGHDNPDTGAPPDAGGCSQWAPVCSEPTVVDPRVRVVLAYLGSQELDRPYTSLVHLAQIAHLSPSRLMHLFTKSVGIPLRQYVLWLRLQRATQALAQGCSVTYAAHLAGFADASHLSRTMRRMIAISPRAAWQSFMADPQ